MVAGGRQFSDEAYLADVIERSLADYAPAELLRGITPEGYGPLQIVSGGAAGADRLGEQWAAARGVPVQQYPAQWDVLDAPGAVVKTRSDGVRYNARAGFDRNVLMARNADAVLVMPGGKGTDHMVQTALAQGLPVWDARAGDARAVVLLEPPRRVDAVAPRPAATAASGKPAAAASMGIAQPAAASAPLPFEIVASRGPSASFDVLGMRERGQTMATVSAPFEPGWLGNPFVAVDAGGRLSREEATAAFGELVREKAQDAAWRDAFLSLRGKRIGYYKPEEPAIHLHELQRWIAEQDGDPAAAGVAEAAAGPRRVQLELALDGGGSPPPLPPPPQLELAGPPEPGPGAGPAPAEEPPLPPREVVENPERKAGDLLPWLLVGGAGGLLGLGAGLYSQQGDGEELRVR